MRDHSHHIELSREQAVAQMIECCKKAAKHDPTGMHDYSDKSDLATKYDPAGKHDQAVGNYQYAGQGQAANQEVDIRHLGRVEAVRLDEGFGRVLAKDVHSRLDMPNALTCAMDSIAVHWYDFEQGMPDTSNWARGIDWEFANTGIAMPAGFDTAIVVEHVEVSDDEQHVRISAAPSKRFAGTRAVGSRIKAGELLARSGEIISPDVAARIASGNVSAVQVFCKPKVAFIPTGNELVCAGGHIAEGKNIETNSLLVRGKVEEWGGISQIYDVVPDNPEAIVRAVRQACETADIVVLNAGSSKGSDDWSVEQLEEIGEVICHQTNHGPGHHSSYAMVDGTPIVGISGPPLGASFTLDFYLRPLIRLYLGLEPELPRIPVRLLAAFHASSSSVKVVSYKTADGTAASGNAASDTTASEVISLPGETRPSVVTDPDAVFYSVKFLNVSVGADGVLQGVPLAGRPGSAEAEGANAYYMMPTGAGTSAPQVGDIIEVELC